MKQHLVIAVLVAACGHQITKKKEMPEVTFQVEQIPLDNGSSKEYRLPPQIHRKLNFIKKAHGLETVKGYKWRDETQLYRAWIIQTEDEKALNKAYFSFPNEEEELPSTQDNSSSL